MRSKFFLPVLGLAVLSALVIGASQEAAAKGGSKFEVTVTNLTRGQIISPVIVATHSRDLAPLFELGSQASDELAAVAEDALNDGLVDALEEDPSVKDVKIILGAADVIMPGESASVEVFAPGKYRLISMVAMLVTTNDAFFAFRGVWVPRSGSKTRSSPAYDAGSEANNEDCDFIPGPPCGNGGIRAPDGAEGYVHIHAGIHGVDDLDPAVHDWRNPVAKVTIRRLNN